MKKKLNASHWHWQWLEKMFRVMKIGFFLLVLNLTSVYAITFSQQKVNLDVKNESLLHVLDILQEQSGYTFLFSSADVKKVTDLSVKAENEDLFDVLKRCLQGTDLVFEVSGQLVVLRYRAPGENKVKPVVLKGFVQDTRKQPLPGVTIRLVGTTAGTATDAKGWFRITLPVDSGKLELSFVGFKNKQVTFNEKTAADTLRVTMEEDIETLEEVVVTGYQTLKEKGMAGAYSKVKVEDLVMTGNETIESMLQGKIPGMVVINQSGLTGTRQKVRVRGTSTLIGNADPVWVVDGIIQEDNLPFEVSELANINDNVDMMRDFIGGAISWLNPNDIDDITVLKDASATAIYGVKAANGVILITTKKGERGRMSVNYAGNFTTSQRMNYNRQEVMNSKERVDLSREAFERGARVGEQKVGYTALAQAYANRAITLEEFHSGVKKLETMNEDWFDILYRTPFSQSHSLSFSGGNEDATYRAAFGYRNVKNTAKGNEQVSYTGSLNTSMNFWQKLTVTASLSGSHTETKAFATGVDPFGYAINTSRVIGCFEDDGELLYYTKNGYQYNILNELANSGNENTQKSLTLNLNARWRLMESLALSATLGGTTSSSFANTWFSERSNYISGIRQYEFGEYGPSDKQFQESLLPYGGMLTVAESRNFNYTARVQAEYVELLNGVHSLNLMAGVETRSNKYDGYSQTNWGYQPDRGMSFVDVPVQTPNGTLNPKYARSNPSVSDRILNYFSYYATAGYMYDNRYSINLSVRGDASNAFGSDSRFLPVWSAGLRWNVIDEHWMREQNFVNNLAFTASVGYQGSVVEGVGPDLVTKILPVDSQTGEYKMEVVQLPNPDLKWEKTLSVNLGVDFALFNSKLNGTFNWYYKKTTDLITNARVPYENGTTGMYVNDGDVTNRGWDLAFSVVPIRTKDFMWSLGTSFSGNSNDVNSELQPNGSWRNAVGGTTNKKGYPVGAFWAFKFKGLDPSNGKPLFDISDQEMGLMASNYTDAYGEVADATEYMVYVGTREPTFTMGLNMMFRWKRFSFPLNVYFSRGNKEFLASPFENGYSMLSEYQNASDELKKRWRKPGDEKRTNIPSIPVNDNCRPYIANRPTGGTMTTNFYPLDAWAYSDIRVVDAWFVRFSDLKLAYSLPEKWIKSFAKDVTLSFTMTNPLQIRSKDFKGRDPEVALGQQPRSRDFSFGVNISF